jgi:DNA-binding NtrC family response regulator
MPQATVLVVDDESLVRWSLTERLAEDGHRMVEAGTGREALQRAAEGVDLVLLDYKLPDSDGISILSQLKERDRDVPVILLTAHQSVELAVQAMKAGAYHYANKPFNLDEVSMLVDKALETTRLRREVRALRASESAPYSVDRIVGTSSNSTQLKALIAKVAASRASTVLLTGESGTGKDLAAKVVHYNSERAGRPFMNITCSALPEALLESELFGHERGAFTDARQQKLGLLETADGGTVFLDEIGEMVPALQAKLLRFLEERAFRRVGGSADIHVDVRVIAATNRDLEEAVREGKFREDLYYRLNVMRIELPPLRERRGDIPVLTKYFVDSFNTEFRKNVKGLTAAAEQLMVRYTWPGNIRELKNAVERAMLLAESDRLEESDFPLLGMRRQVVAGFELPADGVDLETLERDLVRQALRRTGGNQTKAAALLGLNRDQIRYRIEKFGLEKGA